MHPTVALARFKARRPLLSFRANKDYYKGNRQAALPGGHRTGAPGVHINRRPGYQLLENKVRVFVAPPIEDILASPLKPYIAPSVHLSRTQRDGVFREGMPDGGVTPAHFLSVARKHHLDQERERSKAGQARAEGGLMLWMYKKKRNKPRLRTPAWL
ncbi:hypothetical protein C8R43DRAFT_1140810 [Mycena crocata]|nr:hypothetical protein C8R43DRAFT_1140810 [Mycena crocata]